MGTIVTISIISTLCFFAVLGFFLNFRKRSRTVFGVLIDIGFLILNVILSIYIADGIADLIVTPNRAYTILSWVNGGAEEGTLAELVEQMELGLRDGAFLDTVDLRLVFVFVEIIISPVVFLASFVILGIIFFIAKFFVKKLFPETDNIAMRISGGILGAFKNVLVVSVILVPIAGYGAYAFNTLHSVADATDNKEIDDLIAEVSEYETIFTEGPLNAINVCGGSWLFETLTTAHVDDVKVSLLDETENMIDIYKSVYPLVKIDGYNFTTYEADMVDEAVDDIEKSEYLTAMVASVLSQCSKELYENKRILSVERPTAGEIFDPVVDKFLETLSTTTRAGLVDDLHTFAEIFRGTVENGLYRELNAQEGNMYLVFENSKFYSDILQSLHRNERTRYIVPTLANAMQSYLYKVYEEINGFPYGSGEASIVDEGRINEESLNKESQRIATAVQEIHKFTESTAGAVYVEEMVKQGDFVALGTALNQMRDSIFVSGSYEFLLNSILHSEACAKLGIFDANFVNSAIGDPDNPNDDADMVVLLLSRQNLAVLTISMWDGDKVGQENALKVLIANMTYDRNDPNAEQLALNEAEALKELAELENLGKYGVGGDKGETVSSVTETLVDTIHNHIYEDKNGDGVVDQADIDMEAEATAHIITIIAGVHDDTEGVNNVFGSEGSKTGESAEDFVSNVASSSIASEMMENALKENEYDPYGIHGTLSDEDKQNVEDALRSEYRAGTDKTTLENLAAILGVEFRP